MADPKKIRTSNGIIKRLLGEVAGLIGGVQDLIVEDREVEGQTQADGVRGRQLGLSNLGGGLVGLERLVGRVLAAVANSELGKVAVVVTLPVCGLELTRRTTGGVCECGTDILW
jgi:hypothetical protein